MKKYFFIAVICILYAISFTSNSIAQSFAFRTKEGIRIENKQLGISFILPDELSIYSTENPGPFVGRISERTPFILFNQTSLDEISISIIEGLLETNLDTLKHIDETEPASPGRKRNTTRFIYIGESGTIKAIEMQDDYLTEQGTVSGRGRAITFVLGNKGFMAMCSSPVERFDDANITLFEPFLASIKKPEEIFEPTIQASPKDEQASMEKADTFQEAYAYKMEGDACARREDYDGAIEKWTYALRIKPDFTELYFYRGSAYGLKENYDMAISDFNQVLELQPDRADVLMNRGVIYGKKGDYTQAIADFDRAIELNQTFSHAYYNRGKAYFEKGEYERAIIDFNRTLEINPGYADAYYNRSMAYKDLGKYDEAWNDVHKIWARGANVPSGFLNELKQESGRDK